MTAPKKLFIKTYGCQMNVYDSERMAEALGGQGYVQTDTPDEADMILLNLNENIATSADEFNGEDDEF